MIPSAFLSFFVLRERLKVRSQTIISFRYFPCTRLSFMPRVTLNDRDESTLWLWYCIVSRAHTYIYIYMYTCACRTYIRTQKWSELHRLARLRIHPRSRWGVPGVRDQLGRTASSISQKGLPTVSRWRHRRRWSDSSITNRNSWDRLRLIGTHRATRDGIVYTRNCDAP